MDIKEEYKNNNPPPCKSPEERLVVSLLAWVTALVDVIIASIIAFGFLPLNLKYFTHLPSSAKGLVHWAQVSVNVLWVVVIVVLVWLFVRYFLAIRQQRGAIV